MRGVSVLDFCDPVPVGHTSEWSEPDLVPSTK